MQVSGWNTPPTQAITPAEPHSPTPHVVGWSAAPLSIAPSQSLSRLSQISALGEPGVHVSGCSTPPTQAITPAEPHSPTPHVVG